MEKFYFVTDYYGSQFIVKGDYLETFKKEYISEIEQKFVIKEIDLTNGYDEI